MLIYVKSVVQCKNKTKQNVKVKPEHSFRLVMEMRRGRFYSNEKI